MGFIGSSIRGILYLIKSLCLFASIMGLGMVVAFALIGYAEVDSEKAKMITGYALIGSVISFVPWLIFRWIYGGMKRVQYQEEQYELIQKLYDEGYVNDKGLKRAEEIID